MIRADCLHDKTGAYMMNADACMMNAGAYMMTADAYMMATDACMMNAGAYMMGAGAYMIRKTMSSTQLMVIETLFLISQKKLFSSKNRQ